MAQKYLSKEQRWSQCQCHEMILPRFSCWRADTRPLVYSVLLSPLSPLFIKTTLRFSQAVLNVNMGNKKENSGVTASSHNCTSLAECVMKCKGSPVKDCIQCYNHTSLHPGRRSWPLGLLYLHQHLNTLKCLHLIFMKLFIENMRIKRQRDRWFCLNVWDSA